MKKLMSFRQKSHEAKPHHPSEETSKKRRVSLIRGDIDEDTLGDIGVYTDVKVNKLSKEMKAAWFGEADKLQTMSRKGELKCKPDKDGITSLHIAAAHGHLECVELILNDTHVHVDSVDFSGKTALTKAIEGNFPDVVERLLRKGSNPNMRDHLYQTPLLWCAYKNEWKSAEILFRYHADPQQQDKNGYTALHIAILNGFIEFSKRMIRTSGISLDLVGGEKSHSALMMAAHDGYEQVVKELVDAGASTIIKNTDGFTALDLAINRDHDNIISILQSATANERLSRMAKIGDSNIDDTGESMVSDSRTQETFDEPYSPEKLQQKSYFCSDSDAEDISFEKRKHNENEHFEHISFDSEDNVDSLEKSNIKTKSPVLASVDSKVDNSAAKVIAAKLRKEEELKSSREKSSTGLFDDDWDLSSNENGNDTPSFGSDDDGSIEIDHLPQESKNKNVISTTWDSDSEHESGNDTPSFGSDDDGSIENDHLPQESKNKNVISTTWDSDSEDEEPISAIEKKEEKSEAQNNKSLDQEKYSDAPVSYISHDIDGYEESDWDGDDDFILPESSTEEKVINENKNVSVNIANDAEILPVPGRRRATSLSKSEKILELQTLCGMISVDNEVDEPASVERYISDNYDSHSEFDGNVKEDTARTNSPEHPLETTSEKLDSIDFHNDHTDTNTSAEFENVHETEAHVAIQDTSNPSFIHEDVSHIEDNFDGSSNEELNNNEEGTVESMLRDEDLRQTMFSQEPERLRRDQEDEILQRAHERQRQREKEKEDARQLAHTLKIQELARLEEEKREQQESRARAAAISAAERASKKEEDRKEEEKRLRVAAVRSKAAEEERLRAAMGLAGTNRDWHGDPISSTHGDPRGFREFGRSPSPNICSKQNVARNAESPSPISPAPAAIAMDRYYFDVDDYDEIHEADKKEIKKEDRGNLVDDMTFANQKRFNIENDKINFEEDSVLKPIDHDYIISSSASSVQTPPRNNVERTASPVVENVTSAYDDFIFQSVASSAEKPNIDVKKVSGSVATSANYQLNSNDAIPISSSSAMTNFECSDNSEFQGVLEVNEPKYEDNLLTTASPLNISNSENIEQHLAEIRSPPSATAQRYLNTNEDSSVVVVDEISQKKIAAAERARQFLEQDDSLAIFSSANIPVSSYKSVSPVSTAITSNVHTMNTNHISKNVVYSNLEFEPTIKERRLSDDNIDNIAMRNNDDQYSVTDTATSSKSTDMNTFRDRLCSPTQSRRHSCSRDSGVHHSLSSTWAHFTDYDHISRKPLTPLKSLSYHAGAALSESEKAAIYIEELERVRQLLDSILPPDVRQSWREQANSMDPLAPRLEAGIVALQSMMERQASERRSLRSTVNSLEVELDALQEKYHRATRATLEAENSLTDVSSQLRKTEVKLAQKQERCTTLESQVNTIHEDNMKLAVEVQKALESKSATDLRMHVVTARSGTLERDLENLRIEMSRSQERFTSETTASSLQNKFYEEQLNIQRDLLEQNRQHNEALVGAKDAVTLSVETAASVKSENISLCREIDTLRSARTQAQQLFDQLRSSMESEVERLRRDYQEQTESAREAKHQLDHLNTKYQLRTTELQAQLAAATQLHDAEATDRSSLTANIQSLQSRLDIALSNLNKAIEERAVAEKTLATERQTSNTNELSATREISRLRETVSSIESRNATLDKASTSLKIERGELKIELRSALEQIASLRAAKEDAMVAGKDFEDALNQERDVRRELSTKLDSMSERNLALRDQNSILKENLKDSEAKCLHHNDQLMKTQDQFAQQSTLRRVETESEFEALKLERCDLREEVARLLQERRTAHDSANETRTSLAHALGEISGLRCTLESERTRRKEFEDLSDEQGREIHRLKASLENVEYDIGNMRMSKQKLEQELDDKNHVELKLTQQIREFKDSTTSSIRQKEEDDNVIIHMKHEIETLQTSVKVESIHRIEAETQLESLRNSHVVLEQDAAEMKRLAADNETRFTASVAKLRRTQKEVDEIKRIWEQEAKSRSKEGYKVVEMQRSTEDCKFKVRRASEKRHEAEQRAKVAIEAQQVAEGEIAALSDHLRDLKRILHDERSAKNEMRRRLKEMTSEQQKDTKALLRDISKLKEQLEKQSEELASSRAEATKSAAEVGALRTSKKLLDATVSQEARARTEILRAKDLLQVEVDELRALKLKNADYETLKVRATEEAKNDFSNKLLSVQQHLEEQTAARATLERVRNEKEREVAESYERTVAELRSQKSSLETEVQRSHMEARLLGDKMRRIDSKFQNESHNKKKLVDKLEKAKVQLAKTRVRVQLEQHRNAMLSDVEHNTSHLEKSDFNLDASRGALSSSLRKNYVTCDPQDAIVNDALSGLQRSTHSPIIGTSLHSRYSDIPWKHSHDSYLSVLQRK